MMHGDEGIGVDRLKELGPDPSTHDGIMEHGPSHIHNELVPLAAACHFCIPARTSGLSSCLSQNYQ
jgi:hypothetical protein